MADTFAYNVFLSHSAKDKAVVPSEFGIVIFQPSAFYLRPFWCAPLNQERRFIPLRLDDRATGERGKPDFHVRTSP